jgi:hypothetical protein
MKANAILEMGKKDQSQVGILELEERKNTK